MFNGMLGVHRCECGIGDDGIEALMSQLQNCRSLINFYVFDNCVTDEGAKIVIDTLPKCPSLVQFGIGGNQINEDSIERLKAAWNTRERATGNSIYVR